MLNQPVYSEAETVVMDDLNEDGKRKGWRNGD